jgi:hypothetical protein
MVTIESVTGTASVVAEFRAEENRVSTSLYMDSVTEGSGASLAVSSDLGPDSAHATLRGFERGRPVAGRCPAASSRLRCVL